MSPERKVDSTVATLRFLLDVGCAAFGLVLLFPVLALIALAIKLDDGGAIFYAQPRIGKHFCSFRLLKFRSMVPGADKTGLLTSAHDPRQTRVGRFLRKYKLDELPQLVNVLKGDMQLVGPRPEVECYVQMFRAEYSELLEQRPGITDPASLVYCHEEEALPEEAPEEWYISHILPEKLKLSVAHHRGRGFLSDLHILWQTAIRVPRYSAAVTTQVNNSAAPLPTRR